MPIGRALEDNEFLHAEMFRVDASDGGELVNRTPGARPGDAADRHPVQAQRLQMALHVRDEGALIITCLRLSERRGVIGRQDKGLRRLHHCRGAKQSGHERGDCNLL